MLEEGINGSPLSGTKRYRLRGSVDVRIDHAPGELRLRVIELAETLNRNGIRLRVVNSDKRHFAAGRPLKKAVA